MCWSFFTLVIPTVLAKHLTFEIVRCSNNDDGSFFLLLLQKSSQTHSNEGFAVADIDSENKATRRYGLVSKVDDEFLPRPYSKFLFCSEL